MSSLSILTPVTRILIASLMLFLIFIVYGSNNYHVTGSQDEVIFLETFEEGLKIIENSNDTVTGPELIQEPIPRPILNDPNLKTEIVFSGLDFPTSIAFLGNDDILVLEKNDGTVRRIVNGQMITEPLLDVNVSTQWTRGMLGISVSNNSATGTTNVFLFYTESGGGRDGDDECPSRICRTGTDPIGNRLYKYELIDNKLVNPKLLLHLPAAPSPSNNGGVVIVGPDNNIYLMVGDLTFSGTIVTNNMTGLPADGRAGILRLTQDGKPVEGLLGDTYPLNLYYAYGIRNGFGMDFDPVTGNLWDTENGPAFGDEINLVEPGFNSGWRQVHGIWKPNEGLNEEDLTAGDIVSNYDNLSNFEGRGQYSEPEFIWEQVVAPTAIKFLDSNKLGNKYANDIFVASTSGKIYHFDLNEERTGLILEGSLSNRIGQTSEELESLIFGEDFHAISDLEVGPDHNLYVVSYGSGSIFKIVASKD